MSDPAIPGVHSVAKTKLLPRCSAAVLLPRRLPHNTRSPRAGTRAESIPKTMNLHEYQAKQLFARYAVPVTSGEVAGTPAQACLL